jgi:2-phosphoglycerate kinase
MTYKETRPIILIGGASCTGKSTLASDLSKHLNLPWCSTDQFRQIMKFIGDPDKAPYIFDSSNHTAESYHKKYSAQDIINIDYQQSLELWPHLKEFLKDDWSWKEGFIVEGVNITPKIVKENLHDMPNVKILFLVDESEKRTRETVYRRGVWDDADTYPDHVKENEIKWVTLAMEQIKQDCKRLGLPCLSISKDDKDLEKALTLLKL